MKLFTNCCIRPLNLPCPYFFKFYFISEMSETKTYANLNVLELYKVLPFNYFDAVEDDVKSILSKNAIKDLVAVDQILKQNMTVLDLGCGAGWFSNSLAHYYGCQVTGIDFNPVAIERAREVGKLLNLKSRFNVCDLFLYQPDIKTKVT